MDNAQLDKQYFIQELGKTQGKVDSLEKTCEFYRNAYYELLVKYTKLESDCAHDNARTNEKVDLLSQQVDVVTKITS